MRREGTACLPGPGGTGMYAFVMTGLVVFTVGIWLRPSTWTAFARREP